ncbi:TPA: hypothetical protein ACGI4L_001475 [Clostridioides difficile]
MSKVIQCDFCKKVSNKISEESIELYKARNGTSISMGKHMCEDCYGKLVEGKIENDKNFKEELIGFLVKHEICDCCTWDCIFDSNNEKKCKAGIREWVESEVED